MGKTQMTAPAAEDIRKRLSNKAHIFDLGATLCSRCGYSIIEALSTPVRCAGVVSDWQTADNPMTLTRAIDRAENPR